MSEFERQLEKLSGILGGRTESANELWSEVLGMISQLDKESLQATESGLSILNNAMTQVNLESAGIELDDTRSELKGLLRDALESYARFEAIRNDVKCRIKGDPTERGMIEMQDSVMGSYIMVIMSLVGQLTTQETNNPAQGEEQG